MHIDENTNINFFLSSYVKCYIVHTILYPVFFVFFFFDVSWRYLVYQHLQSFQTACLMLYLLSIQKQSLFSIELVQLVRS